MPFRSRAPRMPSPTRVPHTPTPPPRPQVKSLESYDDKNFFLQGNDGAQCALARLVQYQDLG